MSSTSLDGSGFHYAEEPAHLAPEPVKPATEQKVTAASRGAGIGGALAALIVWALSEYVFDQDVPGEVSTFVILALPMIGARIDGWRAPHTARPDLHREET